MKDSMEILSPREEICSSITGKEIERMIRKMKKDVASEEHGLLVKVVQERKEVAAKWLLEVCNEVCRKNFYESCRTKIKKMR